MNEDIFYGTEDYLRDLGASPEEAMKKRLRFDLAIEIQGTIAANGWTQVEAAKNLSVSQSRISYLLNGHIEKFSLDALLEMFGRIGGRVAVVKEKSPNAA
jgi:predicted XRE-type DNA-binding protein